jgi:transcription elongation GreA/GreB family factor
MSGKRKKRKIHLTREELAAQEARTRELMELIRRAEIELATGKRPPPEPAA